MSGSGVLEVTDPATGIVNKLVFLAKDVYIANTATPGFKSREQHIYGDI